MQAQTLSRKLMTLGPLGYFFALILGPKGHLATLPLAIGAAGGLLGFALQIATHPRQEAAR